MIHAGKSTKRGFSKKALAGIENLFLPSKSIDTWSIWSVKLYLYSQLNLWKRYRARPLLIRPLQVPKYLCNTKKFQSIFFCPRPKEDFHLVISVFVPTQFFWLALNAIQLLVWPKKLGSAKNIWGPIMPNYAKKQCLFCHCFYLPEVLIYIQVQNCHGVLRRLVSWLCMELSCGHFGSVYLLLEI